MHKKPSASKEWNGPMKRPEEIDRTRRSIHTGVKKGGDSGTSCTHSVGNKEYEELGIWNGVEE